MVPGEGAGLRRSRGCALRLGQLRAMLTKRALHTARHIKPEVLQMLLPVVFCVGALAIGAGSRGVAVEPCRELSLWGQHSQPAAFAISGRDTAGDYFTPNAGSTGSDALLAKYAATGALTSPRVQAFADLAAADVLATGRAASVANATGGSMTRLLMDQADDFAHNGFFRLNFGAFSFEENAFRVTADGPGCRVDDTGSPASINVEVNRTHRFWMPRTYRRHPVVQGSEGVVPGPLDDAAEGEGVGPAAPPPGRTRRESDANANPVWVIVDGDRARVAYWSGTREYVPASDDGPLLISATDFIEWTPATVGAHYLACGGADEDQSLVGNGGGDVTNAGDAGNISPTADWKDRAVRINVFDGDGGGNATRASTRPRAVTGYAWYNHKAIHSAPEVLNAMGNLAAKASLEGDPALHAWNCPLPKAAADALKDAATDPTGFYVAVFLTLSFAFMTSSFSLFVVGERASNAKHIQYVSGVSSLVYWSANYAWDAGVMTVCNLLIVIVFAVFDNKAYRGESLAVLVVVLQLFACAVLPLVYRLSFAFQSAASAYASLTVGLVFATFVFLLANMVLTALAFHDEAR